LYRCVVAPSRALLAAPPRAPARPTSRVVMTRGGKVSRLVPASERASCIHFLVFCKRDVTPRSDTMSFAPPHKTSLLAPAPGWDESNDSRARVALQSTRGRESSRLAALSTSKNRQLFHDLTFAKTKQRNGPPTHGHESRRLVPTNRLRHGTVVGRGRWAERPGALDSAQRRSSTNASRAPWPRCLSRSRPRRQASSRPPLAGC
jgi:hypothetical protein